MYLQILEFNIFFFTIIIGAIDFVHGNNCYTRICKFYYTGISRFNFTIYYCNRIICARYVYDEL